MADINKEGIDAINELMDKYTDAVSTLTSILKKAREHNLQSPDVDFQDVHSFAGWVQGQIPYWEHELVKRHGVKL